ncbi:hypothetical protein XBFFL1_740009 [Xenorhabdus bovienii str. feltiae Florida]|nr:hypothetical protein XBFFR1_1560009 [Xenorhabdus bovienii str. feltiae France]CDG94509.1 hypothetical protein XBFFL1_740009 [Xenorhabdus bovienii str. feltiae Florida]
MQHIPVVSNLLLRTFCELKTSHLAISPPHFNQFIRWNDNE